MKKVLLMLCSVFLVAFSCAGCTGSSGSSSGSASGAGSAPQTSSQAKPLNFPKKDIKVIIPFSAGGGADLSMRMFCDTANNGDYFNNVTLVPENLAGGGATVGQTAAYNAKADGYTLLLYTSSLIDNTIFNKVVYKYDDFKPLAGYCTDPEILIAPISAPYNTLQEFYTYAKTHTVNVSTPGRNTGHHIRALKMAQDHSFKFNYLHSDGAAVQLQQVMGGHCDISFTTVGGCESAIKDGKVKALAVMAEDRLEDLPKVPTFKELGENLVDGADRGIAVNKNVPDDVYQYLCAESKKVIETQQFKDSMKKLGVMHIYQTPEEYKRYMDDTYNTIQELLPFLRAT